MEKGLIQQLVEIGGVDMEATLDRFIGNANLYEKFLVKFPEDHSFENLGKAIAGGNIEDAFMHAHALKGIAGNLGFQHLFDLMSPWAENLKKGIWGDSNERYKELSRQYDAICHIIGTIKA